MILIKRALLEKLKEALVSVLPVTVIVFLVSLTPAVSFSLKEYLVFAVSALLMIAGIGLFNLGADLAMTPMGEHVGEGLTKSKRIGILLSVSLVMGILITIAEPDLSVLAGQVSAVIVPGVLITAVGAGVGLFLLLAAIKIILRYNLNALLFFFYMVLFMLSAVMLEHGKNSLLPLAFDSGGVTTGPVTVPFIMALGVGIAQTVGGRRAHENSFGLVALCSVGPIVAVLALCITASGSIDYAIPDYSIPDNLGPEILFTLAHTAREVARSLLLIFAFFGVLQLFVLHLPWQRIVQILVGVVYTFVGLVLFLSVVSIGFMPIGYQLGRQLAASGSGPLIAFGFLIGMVVVLAEPAVHVLNMQVEDITGGQVTKRQMMVAMSLGVGISIGLSMLRIIRGFSILYYLIPGYILSLGLSFFIPPLYTAIAFDSGGVASGPLTSSFILPMAIGACVASRGGDSVLESAFGIVAMVAMTPLITIQSLGFKSIVQQIMRTRRSIKRILASDEAQIIYFR